MKITFPSSNFSPTEFAMNKVEAFNNSKAHDNATKAVASRAVTCVAIPVLATLGVVLHTATLAVKTPLVAIKGTLQLITKGKYGTFGATSLNSNELKGHAKKIGACALAAFTPAVGLFSTKTAIAMHEKLGLKQKKISIWTRTLNGIKAGPGAALNAAKKVASATKNGIVGAAKAVYNHKKKVVTTVTLATAGYFYRNEAYAFGKEMIWDKFFPQPSPIVGLIKS